MEKPTYKKYWEANSSEERQQVVENAFELIDKLEQQLLIQSVSQRSELFADQDSKEFVLWQRDREIHRESNDCYKWREFKYNRNFFLEKYQEDLNKANCG